MIRVLIIDDDRLSLSGIKTMLPWEKHQMQIVGEAYNGKEGLRFLEKHTVDLVMLDLAMPIIYFGQTHGEARFDQEFLE